MITGIGHNAYRVRDVDASIAFYAQLGIHESFRLHKPDGSLWIVFLRVNDRQRLELLPGGDRPADTTGEPVGYHHFSLLVDDLARAVDELTAGGVTITSPRRLGEDGNLQAWVTDPDGNGIELMQLMPGALDAVPRPEPGDRGGVKTAKDRV